MELGTLQLEKQLVMVNGFESHPLRHPILPAYIPLQVLSGVALAVTQRMHWHTAQVVGSSLQDDLASCGDSVWLCSH